MKVFDNVIINNKAKCGPGAVLDSKGNCKCLFFGNPFDEIGCYDCHPACGEGAICTPPEITQDLAEERRPNHGKCKCLPGFYKYGSFPFLTCKLAIPDIISYFPISGKLNSAINFTLRSLNDFTAENVYCKFNETVSIGKKINNNLIQCTVPNEIFSKKSTFFFVSLSYDKSNWTTTHVPFEVIGVPSKFQFTHVLIYGSILALIGGILLISYIYYGLTSGEGMDANEPLLMRDEKY